VSAVSLEFDYIVIGAGSAGCVVANRLSASGANRVCVLEAGPSDRPLLTALRINTPPGNTTLLNSPRFNWGYQWTGGRRLRGRLFPCPRGRVVGGTSAVNGMVYIRGHKSDYDDWAALGNRGWSYADVLPFFKKHEHRELGTGEYHGAGGELNVAPLRFLNPITRAFLEAGQPLQLGRNDDFNGAQQEGIGPYEVTQKNGERCSSARAFLHPALSKKNLELLTGAMVLRINFAGRRAVSVTIRRDGAESTISATREIILSGGAINSPHLLMLSGIGGAGALQRAGIKVIHDAPGVGANLQDHPTIGVKVEDLSRSSFAVTPWTLLPFAWSGLRYALTRQGRFTSNIVEAGGFIRTSPDLERPDIQLILMVAARPIDQMFPYAHAFMIGSILLRPTSRGRVELVSADPATPPVLHPNFLADDKEIPPLIAGLRLSRRIAKSPPFRGIAGMEQSPGAASESDEQLRDYILGNIGTSYHPAGTCKMGPPGDVTAVVDDRLRVHGTEGLRVADASIMPSIVGGNTNAPAMMIGERCADFILRSAAA
jgi:choline dehydrogenase